MGPQEAPGPQSCGGPGYVGLSDPSVLIQCAQRPLWRPRREGGERMPPTCDVETLGRVRPHSGTSGVICGTRGDCYVSDLAQVDREVTNRNPSLLITPGTADCLGVPGEAGAVLPQRKVEETSRAPWTPQTHPLSVKSERGAQGLRPGAGKPQGQGGLDRLR